MGLAYSWKEIYVSKVFTETRLEDIDLTKTQLCKYRKQWYVQSFGTRKSSLPNAKIYMLLYSFCFVLFSIWG